VALSTARPTSLRSSQFAPKLPLKVLKFGETLLQLIGPARDAVVAHDIRKQSNATPENRQYMYWWWFWQENQ
jgi:hypothetical protein